MVIMNGARDYRVLLLLCWAVLNITPSVQGFSVTNQVQATPRKQCDANTNYATNLNDIRDASVLETELGGAEADEKANRLSRTLREQKVVVYTALAVALTAAVTKNVAWQGLRRNMLAGTVIFSVGDWGAQLLTRKQSDNLRPFLLDHNRFVISAVLGSLWAGMVNPSVYGSIERILPGATSIGRVLLKMAFSCSILSTAGNFVSMLFRRFLYRSLEQPQNLIGNLLESIESCKQDFLEVLRDDLRVWPLYDIVCFSLIPPSVRPISNAFMASAWSMYMSIVSAKTTATEDAASSGKESEPLIVEDQEEAIQLGYEGSPPAVLA